MATITAGTRNSLFLDEDGNLWHCGFSTRSDIGQESPFKWKPVELEGIQLVSVHTNGVEFFFIDKEKCLWASGQLEGTKRLHQMKELGKVESVATSLLHSLLLDAEGGVLSYGNGTHGQLGSGKHASASYVPQIVPNLPKIKTVAAGTYHSLFLDREGGVWTCGSNTFGELGLGDTSMRFAPEKITNLPSIYLLVAGSHHSLFLDESGGVWGCGHNTKGQIGCGASRRFVLSPEKIDVISEIQDIATGNCHSLYLDQHGTVWGSGLNDSSQLGTESDGCVLLPEQISQLPKIQAIFCGEEHSLFLDHQNYLWGCGANAFGQLLGVQDDVLSAPKKLNIPRIMLPNKTRGLRVKSARNII